jgi:stalled ribosome rescue protein Dom34
MNINSIAILLILDLRIVKYNKKLIKIVLSIERMNTKIYVKSVSHPTVKDTKM